jgi:hypothetical protein
VPSTRPRVIDPVACHVWLTGSKISAFACDTPLCLPPAIMKRPSASFTDIDP